MLLIELHEQRMLPILASPHPLHGHPLAVGLELPQSRGTLVVASELGHMRFHPVVTSKGADEEDGDNEPVPGCLIGDYLLFIKDRAGAFCVNINVKESRSEFEVPRVGVTVKTDMARAIAKQTARTRIERQVYLDIGIRTVEVASDELPRIFVANLRQIMLWQKRKHRLSADQVDLVMDALLDGLDRQVSPLEVFKAVELSHAIPQYNQKIVLYQAVFARKVRLDLFEAHFFIDKPMRPETRDAVEVFAHWFQRAA